jgi:asparagine synthase (glutamine-hydrolysing)
MTAAVAHRGTDGISYWGSGPVAFAHLQFWTTPESLDERQPLVSPGGEACVVWNGRLDNRKELLEALAAQGARPVDNTDPGLVLSAYLLWGTECVERLAGDFGLVIWDARIRRLWCARDYAGIRPFYYFWDGKTFLFGPEIGALLAHPLVSLKINEGMAGEYLAARTTSREETLYTDIRRLPSGSTLTIDSEGGFQIASWWRPELSLLQYQTDEEYAEHFLQLFDQSVLSRMRCNARWGVELSGGLDSSSIAVTAQALLDRGGIGSHQDCVLTFSNSSPGKPWDESDYIAAVVQHAGLQSELIEPFRANLDFYRQRAGYWRDFPGLPNGELMLIPMSEVAKRRGARVFMNGIGGDEWLQGVDAHLFDLARVRAIRPMVMRAREDWEIYGGQRRWSIYLARRLASMYAPDGVKALRRRRKLAQNGIFSQEFLRRTNLADRLAAPPERQRRRFASLAQESVFGLVFGGAEAHVFEWNDRDSAHSGVEMRYPFFDRRLAEFFLRLPEDQRQRGTVWKWMLRNAMRGRLPEMVRTRSSKAEFSELFKAVVASPNAEARLEDLTLLKHTDWLDARHFAERLNLPVQPAGEQPLQYWLIWTVLGVDLWLEDVLSRGGSI